VSAAAAAVGSFGIFPKNAYLLQWSHTIDDQKFSVIQFGD